VIKPQTTQRGFTLVELIIAVVVFSVLASIMYPALHGILSKREILQVEMERTASLQKAMLILQTDFEQLRPRRIRDQFGDSQAPFYTPKDGDGLLIEFTRGGRSNPLKQARATLVRVGYGVKDDKLVRYQWQVLDRAQDSLPIEIPLMEEVTSATFKFLGDGAAWSNTWPPATNGSATNLPGNPNGAPAVLPRAVEVVIETKDWGSLRRVFHGVY
jgi:general secretion pathway protein J